jgi:nucleotidyltransferase/DNA polymerase involved in DNA repair
MMFATLYVPNFCLQAALRHQPALHGTPVALIDAQETKATIIQLNEAAAAAGVRCGMTPSQGLARNLKLVVKTRMREQEKMLDALLLHFACTLAPYVEATAPGVATVEFTQTKHVLRNVERIVEQLAQAEITAQAGIAHTPDASFLAAHLAKPVLQVNDAKDFLAPLPIETLAQV